MILSPTFRSFSVAASPLNEWVCPSSPRSVTLPFLASMLVTADDIDVVLTDVVMPGMSGRELADRIGMICPRARVAFMSGYTEDAIVRRGVHSAEIPFIAKPFTADALARHVCTVLDTEAVAAGR